MSGMVLSIDTSGVGSCFYTEAIDLQQIGALEITRASTIEFNIKTQAWEVRALDDQVLFSNPSRHVCLSWEQQNFNR